MTRKAITPSNKNEKEEFYSNIELIVGDISAALKITDNSLKDIDNILKTDIVNTVVQSNSEIIPLLQTTSNMLIALTGYAFGEKGINSRTNINSLLGKIKNTAPVFDNFTNNKNSASIDIIFHGLNESTLDSLAHFLLDLNDITSDEVVNQIYEIVKIINALDSTLVKVNAFNLGNKYSSDINTFVSTINNLFDQITKLSNFDSKNALNQIKKLDFTIISGLLKSLNEIYNIDIPKDFNKKNSNIFSTLYSLISSIENIDEKKIDDCIANINKINPAKIQTIYSSLVNIYNKIRLKNKQNIETINYNIISKISDNIDSLIYSLNAFSDENIIDKIEDSLDNLKIIEKTIITYYIPALNNIFNTYEGIKTNSVNSLNKRIKTIYIVINSVIELSKKINHLALFSMSLKASHNIISTNINNVKLILDSINKSFNEISTIKYNNIDLTVYDSIVDSLSKFILKMIPLSASIAVTYGPSILAEKLITGISKSIVSMINEMSSIETKEIDFAGIDIILSSITKFTLKMIPLSASIAVTYGPSALAEKLIVGIVDNIINIVENISKIKLNKNNNLDKIAEYIKSATSLLNNITLLSISSVFATMSLKVLVNTSKLIADTINIVVENFVKIKANKKSFENIKDIFVNLNKLFASIILLGVLAVPAAAVIILLSVLAPIIVFGLNALFIALNKLNINFDFSSTIDNIGALGLTLLTLTGVLMIGALFMKTGLIVESILFAGAISLFAFGISASLSIINELDLSGTKGLATLVVALSGVLMIGALFMLTGLWIESLKFAAILSLFISGVSLAISLMDVNPRTIAKADKMGILIGTYAGILMIGGLFMLSNKLGNGALKFAALLVGFTALISVTIKYLSNFNNRTIKNLRNMLIFTTVISSILIIGSIFVSKFGAKDILIFAGLTAGFTLIMSGIIILLSKTLKPKDILVALLALAGISLTIIAVANSMKLLSESFSNFGNIKNMWNTVLASFAIIGLVAALTIGIGLLFSASGGIGAVVFLGGIAGIAAIAGVVYILGKAVKSYAESIGDAGKLLGSKENIKNNLELISNMLFDTLWMLTKFGAASVIGMPIVAIGSANAIVLSGSMYAITEAFKQSALNIFEINKLISNGNIDITNINKLINAFINISENITDSGIKVRKIRRFARSMRQMSKALSSIALGIKEFASMTIANGWDSKGNPISYTKLTNEDFLNATTNINMIINALGSAIITAYKNGEKTGIFERGGILGLGKTKFAIVAKSVGSMGKMLSSLSKGIYDMASLKIATEWDSNGNPKTYIKLTDKHFEEVSTNTSYIVTTMASSIVDAYDSNKEIFMQPGVLGIYGFGKTKFDLAVKAISGLGKMMSSIATGIYDMANLNVATEWDELGNPKKYRKLVESDFIEASKNVAKIISTLGSAIIDTYNSNKEIFVRPGIKGVFGYGDTKFDIVVQSATGLGKMISSLATGISEFASGKVAIKWDSNGNAIDYMRLDSETIGKATETINTIITSTYDALISVYNNDKTGFFSKPQTSILWGMIKKQQVNGQSPAEIVLGNALTIGEVLSTIAKSQLDIANINTTDYAEGGKIRKNINAILTAVISEVISVANSDEFKNLDKDIVRNTDILHKAVKSSISSMEEINKLFVETDEPNIDIASNIDKWYIALEKLYNKENLDKLYTNNKDYNKIKNISNIKFDSVEGLVKNVNSIETTKADKFIELINAMKNLSISMGDIEEFMNLFNNKLTDTLNNISTRLSQASETIKLSDAAQDKRQATIKENVEKIKEALSTPMKIEVEKNTGTTAQPKFISNISGPSNTSGTNNTPDPIPYAPSFNRDTLDSKALANISGNTLNILQVLKEYLENK